MNAEFDPEHLSSLFDGELTPSETEQVRRQVDDAPEQRALLEEFAQIRSLLRELPREAAPEGLAAAIRNQIETDGKQSTPSSKPQARFRRLRWVVPCLSACALLMVGLLYYAPGVSDSIQATSPEMLMTDSGPMALKSDYGQSDFESQGLVEEEPYAAEMEYSGAFEAETLSLDDRNAARRGAHAAPEFHAVPMMQPAEQLSDVFPMTPAAPPVGQKDETSRQLAKLVASPKWQNKLRPGELVRYITVDDDEVAVVELSVVDVAYFYGEMQVLLASQQIPPLTETATVADAGEGAETSRAVTTDKQNLGFPGMGENGLLAVYVEATGDQVLRSLEALESMQELHGLSLGCAPERATDAYSVIALTEPDEADAENPANDERVKPPGTTHSFLLEPTSGKHTPPRFTRRVLADERPNTLRVQSLPRQKETEPADRTDVKVKQETDALESADGLSGSSDVAFSDARVETKLAAAGKQTRAYQLPARLLPLNKGMDPLSRTFERKESVPPNRVKGAPAEPLAAKPGIAAEPAPPERPERESDVSCRVLFVIAPSTSSSEPDSNPQPAKAKTDSEAGEDR